MLLHSINLQTYGLLAYNRHGFVTVIALTIVHDLTNLNKDYSRHARLSSYKTAATVPPVP